MVPEEQLPPLQLQYANEDYYQAQVEKEETEAHVNAEEEETEADLEADDDESQTDLDAEEEEVEADKDAYQQQMKGFLLVNYSVTPLCTCLSSGAREHSQEEGPHYTLAEGAHGN